MKMRIVKTNVTGNATIHTQITGEGPSLVLLHGNQQTSQAFHAQVEYFSKLYQVIQLDTRGHGLSTHGEEPFSINLLAQDVSQVISQLGISKFYLVGFSDGANIAIKVALNHPDQVLSLVLISPNIHPSALRLYIRLPLLAFFSVLQALPVTHWRKRQKDFLSLLIHEQNLSLDALQLLKTPTLLIASQYDLIHRRHILLLSKTIPDLSLRWLFGIGHMRLKRNAQQINFLIASFFNTSVR